MNARWLALDPRGKPLGEVFVAPDKTVAEHLTAQRLGPRGWTVMSYLEWVEVRALESALNRMRRRDE